ncbi:NACHT domain-containing protein [Streptomyces sp. CA-111067]|uniref:NACHT domain-containing protein n=1 Tax=Streptomyces sp. CA-111067 TaxID=3240046 RepID=UPI003D96CCDE
MKTVIGATEHRDMAELPGDPLTELARRLRTLKAQRRLQSGGLQQRTGLGRTTLSQALSGSKVPSETTLVLLAKALEADAEPLLALRSAAARPSVSRATRVSGPLSFEQRYRAYVEQRHSGLTVVGLDLSRPDRAHWPLDAAYLSLELAERAESWSGGGDEADRSRSVVKRAEHALSGHRRVLLRGLAGSGKSTLLQWLAVAAAREELPEELADWRDRIPFVLPLRTLVRRGPLPQPQEFLAAVGTPLAASQPERWADAVLARGEGLVLIDGIDEVPQEQRGATRDWLEGLLAAYQDAVFVVTTRPSAVPEGWLASSRFTELTVRPMNAADIGVFVGRWHTAARRGAESADERAHLDELESALRMTVRAQRDLAQLSSTPLMCALVCALHRDRRGHLPHSRMELYQAALSMLLVRRDRERSIDIPEGIQLTEHQSIKLLQRLAYWLIRNRQTEMDYATALVLIGDALPAMQAVAEQGPAEQVLTHLIGRSGLLRQPTADTVDFVHRTFQDYLGAKAAIEAHDFPLLINNAHDDQWEDVIRMAVAHSRPAESTDLLNRLVTRGNAEAEHRPRLHLLAQASLHYATEIEPDTRDLVEQHARALMPPRSEEEADTLASLGPGILDLLPQPQGLEGDEVAAVVRTAAAIGSDQAYVFLQRFVTSLPQDTSSHELVRGWEHFDADQYAQDILSAVREKIYLSVQSHDQRNALRFLTPVTDISFENEEFTAGEITEYLSPKTHALRIYAGARLQNLKFLHSFPTLRELALGSVTGFAHIDDIANHPLADLTLVNLPNEFSLTALNSLPNLTSLGLYTPLSYQNLAELPGPESLTSLHLGPGTGPHLTGISKWQQLRELTMNRQPTPEDWREIAPLPHLEEIFLSHYDLTQAVPMQAVTYLRLMPKDTATQADLIPNIFPNLEKVFINFREATSDIIDITPLARIKNLKLSLSFAKGIVGLEEFDPDAVTLHPRPRTLDI